MTDSEESFQKRIEKRLREMNLFMDIKKEIKDNSNKEDSSKITKVLVQSVNDMTSKLHSIHKDVSNNSEDISEIKQQISFSKGAIKVLLILIGSLTTIIALFKFMVTK